MNGHPIPKMSPISDVATIDAIAEAVERRRAGASGGRSGEYVRWGLGFIVAALLSYFTTIATIDKAIGEVRTTEDNHFQEVLRRLDVMQADMRELRARP